MSRIRTIKPDFFRHEELFEAEKHFQLPLRVAFSGLWTCCDRDGRFRWKPRQLKLDILPYDEIDFSRVLDALATRGFIVKYECNGEVYGWVPSFLKHQVINPRERLSELPIPPSQNSNFPEPQQNQDFPPDEDACSTREARVSETHMHAHGEEEREREREREEEREGKKENKPQKKSATTENPNFEMLWQAYPRKVDKQRAQVAFEKIHPLPEEDQLQTILDAINNQHSERLMAKRYGVWHADWKHFATWLNGKNWNDQVILDEEYWRNEAGIRNSKQNQNAGYSRSAGKSKSDIHFDSCADSLGLSRVFDVPAPKIINPES